MFDKLNICSCHLKDLKGFKLILVSFLRTAYLTLKGFYKMKGTQIASSLTYYSLLAMVPLLTLSFEIANKLKFTDLLQKGLSFRFEKQGAIFAEVENFINNMLSSAENSIIAAIGMSILFLSTIKLLFIIDGFFDKLWKIKSKRKIHNKIIVFVLLILTIPFFLIVSGIIKIIVIQKLHYVFIAHPLFSFLHYAMQLLPYFLICMWFTLGYLLMSRQRRIKFSIACISGFIAGSIYELVGWVYAYFQIGFTNYSIVYASFASLTLFLIWIQLSWIVFLLGARLSYSLQHPEECEYENLSLNTSYRYKMVLTIYAINKSLTLGHNLSYKFLYKVLNFPPVLCEAVLERLESTQLYKAHKEKKEIYYKPQFDTENITIKELVDKIEFYGVNEIEFLKDKNLTFIEKIFHEFDEKLLKSDKNITLKNL